MAYLQAHTWIFVKIVCLFVIILALLLLLSNLYYECNVTNCFATFLDKSVFYIRTVCSLINVIIG